MVLYSNNTDSVYDVDMSYSYEINNKEDLKYLTSLYGVTTSEFEDSYFEDMSSYLDEDYKRFRRCKSNWKSSDTLYLDIDDGFPIKFFNIKFRKFEYYIQTSISHTEEKNKYHVFFPLNQVTNDIDYYSELQFKLVNIRCKEADQSGVDVTKYLSPAYNTEIYHHEGISIEDDLNTIKLSYRKPKSVSKLKLKKTDNPRLIKSLKNVNWDDRMKWIKLGIALKVAGFSFEDWIELSWDDVDEDNMQNDWDNFGNSEFLNKEWLIKKAWNLK